MIYPKDYSLRFIDQEENTAFVIMPFKDEFEEVYGEICQTCIDLKIECKRADEIVASRAIMENILERISKAEVIIADISEKNPNVFYEIGVAYSLRDQDSVILITNNIANNPFDITHRSILVYDARNKMKFRSELKKRIQFSKSFSARKEFFRNYLTNNSVKKSEIATFLDIAEKLSSTKFNILFDILKSHEKEFSDSDIDSLFDFFTQLEEYQDGAIKNATLSIKINVFTSDLILTRFEHQGARILVKSNYNMIHLDNSVQFNFISDYCFRLIEKSKLKSEAVNWLVDYLHNYRMGRIDLVRSKIENFFVQCNDEAVDVAILHMLNSPTITVRESAADICGQKKLYKAIPLLTRILQLEENPHVARSCITALTRLNAKESAKEIYEWMKANRSKWGTQAVSSSLKNIAMLALKELDDSRIYFQQFETIANSK